MNSITITLTGHRPQRIGGYNYYSPLNLAIATKIRNHLLSYLKQGIKVHAISGMALGADTIYALVVLKLKRQGYNITLEAAIPCANHPDNWPVSSQVMWRDIVNQADKVTYVSNESYKPYLMQKRNEFMVDSSNELLSVWDGSTTGGTYNCIQYAKQKEVNIVQVNPKALVIEHKGDLLKSDCDVFMHQANCRSTMGSGIAKSIRAKFPVVYEVDCASLLKPEEKLGTYTYAEVENSNKTIQIVNLYGQLNYGADRKLYTNYEALENALHSYLTDRLEREGSLEGLKIGVPKYMGCARAGGDWSIVSVILQKACDKFGVSIHTYELVEEFTFFWQNKSPFSQWHRSTFTENGKTYTCTEQYMMEQKALLMGDTKTAAKIMSLGYNPREYKALGRRVKPFDAKLWNEKCREIVYQGNLLKFTQNPHLGKQLTATAGTTLVEASPYDTIWGIGLAENDPRAKNRNTWRGTNWLGEVLTNLRIHLIGE